MKAQSVRAVMPPQESPIEESRPLRRDFFRRQRRSSHQSIAAVIVMKATSGNAAANSARPVVQHAQVREHPAEEEEGEAQHRSREDPESDAALPPLEIRERQRHHHHDEHGGGVEDLVPERDLEAGRLLRAAGEQAHVLPERIELELLGRHLVDRQQRRAQHGIPDVALGIGHPGAGQRDVGRRARPSGATGRCR